MATTVLGPLAAFAASSASSAPRSMPGPHPALAYPLLVTPPVPSTPEAKANREANLELIEELAERCADQVNQGPGAAQDLHFSRGMLLARDRIAMLLDEDSPWLELCLFAGWGQDDSTPAGSIVSGIGIINGVAVLVSASIPTLLGGATNEMTVLKGDRLHEIALQNHLPSLNLIQSAGANLQQQFRVFHRGGKAFRALAERSLAHCPTCAVVFGSCTAGGAYNPGMSDHTIMVKEQAQVFLGGPPLVKMATGEVSTAEELGGAEMHSKRSGVSDGLANDEFEAITQARAWVASLNWKNCVGRPSSLAPHPFQSLEPAVDMDSLLDVAQANIKKPWDIRELIVRIVDGSRFAEFKPLYGSNTVCGYAYIGGWPVGIIGNNSVLFPSDANKCTSFIRLCNGKNTPIIFLHNISGFIVGRQYEEAGIIKAGSLMINAVSNSTVPHLSIICGSTYGAGNYAMCGHAYGPRFLFQWPQGRCSVMGSEALAGVMDIVAREGAARRGRKIDEGKQERQKAMLAAGVEAQSDSYYTSSRLLDDGIIDPRDTRSVLSLCLSIVNQEPIEGNAAFAGVSRM